VQQEQPQSDGDHRAHDDQAAEGGTQVQRQRQEDHEALQEARQAGRGEQRTAGQRTPPVPAAGDHAVPPQQRDGEDEQHRVVADGEAADRRTDAVLAGEVGHHPGRQQQRVQQQR
jgi:hypothetical protein